MKLYDFGLDQFNHALTSQGGWVRKSEHLHRAASVLFEEAWRRKTAADELVKTQKRFDSGTPEWEIMEGQFLFEEASLLLAYCFENLLKALWVGQNHPNIQGVGQLPDAIKTHDLCILATACGIPMEPLEATAFRTLTRDGVWRGKYIIPTTRNTNATAWVDHLPTSFLMKKHPGEPDWPDEIISLLSKIHAALRLIPSEQRF